MNNASPADGGIFLRQFVPNRGNFLHMALILTYFTTLF